KTESDFNKDYFFHMLEFINFINEIKSPEQIVKNIDTLLENEREKRIFFKRYNNNYTLEEIGIEENLTRERVRQILKKANDSLSSFLKINKFNIALQLKYISKDMCSVKDLYEIFGQDKIFYINSLIKMNDLSLSFVESLNLIMFKSENTLDEKIKVIINSLPENFKLCNYIDHLIYKLKQLEIKEVTIEQIKDLLLSYEFNIYGEYCFKNKITIIKACELIFKEYLTKPLRIDEKGINIIKNLVYNHLNITLDSNDRALESRIRDIESVLLVDKLTFMHISHINISKKTIIYIKSLLKEAFNKREVINAGYLFENNKELMIKNNINNKYILYSLIHYYYGENYSVGKGNTLDIYIDKDIEYSRENMIINILKENKKMISKDRFIKLTGWSPFKIEDTISKSDLIIRLGNNITTLDYLKITEEEKTKISLILNRLFKNKGFTTSYLILNSLKIDIELTTLIKRLNIDSNEKIAALIKKMFNNIKGHTQFLYNENCEYTSFEDVIIKKYRGIFTKEDIKKYIYEYGYKDMMASTIINNNIDSNKFLEISANELINSYDFNISEEIMNRVVKYIENIFENEDYINLSSLSENYKNELPKIQYSWNIYLIRSILVKKGYRKINRTYTDARYEKLILVKNNSNIKTFDELLYKILKNNYTGKMNEVDIYDYFTKLDLVCKHEDKFDKKIPFDLKNSGKINIDTLGKIYLLN
ncbi:sigma factor-like helix-turn-helix DNA-binding protein, partial [Clostridium tarantellae]